MTVPSLVVATVATVGLDMIIDHPHRQAAWQTTNSPEPLARELLAKFGIFDCNPVLCPTVIRVLVRISSIPIARPLSVEP